MEAKIARAQTIPPRRATNRKLRQRRPLRARLPTPGQVWAATAAGARRTAPLLAGVFALAAVGMGGWRAWAWAKSSPRFALRELVVEGNARVTLETIRRRTGIAPGDNVFAMDLGEVEAALEADPWVERAEVSRRLPDRLHIAIVERRPAAVVLLGAPYLADAEGRMFKRARFELGEADGLVVITGIERSLFAARREVGEALVRTALDVARRWHADPERPALGEIHVSRRGLVLYTLEDAVAIRIGRDPVAQLEARLERFDLIWAALGPEERGLARAIHLDSLTRPDRVTVRLAEAN